MKRSIHEYDDIIDLPRLRPSGRVPMPAAERAAQFAPFSALAGYEDVLRETARLTEERTESAEDEKQRIALLLSELSELLRRGYSPRISVKYFEPDGRKSGGRYVTLRAFLRRIDPTLRMLILDGGRTVRIDDITDIKGSALDAD